MTDNEIKKALECCTTKGANCKGCPAFVKVDRSNCKKYFRGAIDLINRLQAENERLKEVNEKLLIDFNGLSGFIHRVKAAAYKEFAERLKERNVSIYEYNEKIISAIPLTKEDIDNLLKEMIGE